MDMLRALRRRLTAPARPTPKGDRQRWLLVYNCQVLGLANCLNLLSDRIEVEHFDPHRFRREADAISARLADYDRVIASPQVVRDATVDLDRCGALWELPTLSCSAYHPDICYLQRGGAMLKGPLGDYHSLIAYAAFRCGLDVPATLALYRAETYAALGYFARWDAARDTLLGSFRRHGFPLDAHFAGWTRSTEPFMYSLNHPRIACVRDVARCVLARAGLEAAYVDALPQDNLANGPIFPVYPEIAAQFGVQGSMLFKLGGSYRFLRLADFLEQSFRLYREHKG